MPGVWQILLFTFLSLTLCLCIIKDTLNGAQKHQEAKKKKSTQIFFFFLQWVKYAGSGPPHSTVWEALVCKWNVKVNQCSSRFLQESQIKILRMWLNVKNKIYAALQNCKWWLQKEWLNYISFDCQRFPKNEQKSNTSTIIIKHFFYIQVTVKIKQLF